ncbi:hypothetical protein P4S95_26855 [Aneurinibacillus aneurinilyticus]|nr:hypothetical protein [Aneurinibacillus aneurinilyticus]
MGAEVYHRGPYPQYSRYVDSRVNKIKGKWKSGINKDLTIKRLQRRSFMKKKVEDYIYELEQLIELADQEKDKYLFQDPAYEIMDEIEELGNAFDFVEPIFLLVERSPDIDFGGPGPFGSFLEKFYRNGYEDILVKSLQRKPKKYTIFLLERLCNDESNPKREEYCTLLDSLKK